MFSIMLMKSFVSLMYAGMVSRDCLRCMSTTCDKFSVGPEQPETIGLMLMGVLWIFLRKYILCVLTLSSSRVRKFLVVVSKELFLTTLFILRTSVLV